MEPKRRGRFTPEEDGQLRRLVAELGPRTWSLVSSSMPGRTARDCRDRWRYYLSDENSHDPWTPEEDARLFEKIDQYGRRWSQVSQDFPNRSDLAVKRRWSEIFRGRRKILLRDAVKPIPRRKHGSGATTGNDQRSGGDAASSPEKPEWPDWISWEAIATNPLEESMNEW
jgi:hypothetical protein